MRCAQALAPGPNSLPCAHLSVEAGALQTVVKSLTLVEGTKMVFHLQAVWAPRQVLKAFCHLSQAIWVLPCAAGTPLGDLSPLAESSWLRQLQRARSTAWSRGAGHRKQQAMRKSSGFGISHTLSDPQGGPVNKPEATYGEQASDRAHCCSVRNRGWTAGGGDSLAGYRRTLSLGPVL